jgi:hypothetical protein
MKIVNTITGGRTTLQQLLRTFPRIGSVANPAQGIRTVWDNPPTDEQLAAVGYQYVLEVDPPEFGPDEQLSNGPDALINGRWTQTWVVEELAVPEEVDTIAFKLTLHDLNLLPSVQGYVDTLSPVEQIYWQHRSTIRRDSDFIESGRIALGLTQEQVDDLFHAAKARAV